MPPTESGDVSVPMVQSLMRLLYAHDTPDNTLAATESVFEGLRVRLSAVLGASGYATLLARALALTRREHPVLTPVAADASGSLAGRLGAVTKQNNAAVTDGFAAVLTRIASLLAVFVGADLCERLLAAVWQDLQNDAANSKDGMDTE